MVLGFFFYILQKELIYTIVEPLIRGNMPIPVTEYLSINMTQKPLVKINYR